MSIQTHIVMQQLRWAVLSSLFAIAGTIFVLLTPTPTWSADANPKTASQKAEQAIKVILQRNLAAGKLSRQMVGTEGFGEPTRNLSWLRVKDGSGRVRGLNFAIEEDIGCGCCFDWVVTDVSDVDMKLVAQLDSLEQLCLQRTQVTRVGLKHLAALKNLRWLDVSYTSLTDDDVKAIAGLKSLEYLNLTKTRISDVGLRHLAPLKRLREINFEDTLATGEGLDAMQDSPNLSNARGGPKNLRALQAYLKLTGLEQLRVAIDARRVQTDRKQDTPHPIRIVGLPRLQSLSFVATSATPNISVTGLPNLKHLKVLNVEGLEIADLPALHSLTLYGVISRTVLEQASGAKSLRSLSLYPGVGSDVKSLELISQMKNLDLLRIDGDALSSDALAHLNLPETLKILSLSNIKRRNRIIEQGIELSTETLRRLLADAPRLEQLRLSGVKTMPGDELQIAQHDRLRVMTFNCAAFTRVSISNLRSLESLRFYNSSIDTLKLADGLRNLRLGDVADLVGATRRKNASIKEVLLEGSLDVFRQAK